MAETLHAHDITKKQIETTGSTNRRRRLLMPIIMEKLIAFVSGKKS